MNGVFERLFALVLGLLFAAPVESQQLLIFSGDPFVGEFDQSAPSFFLFDGPGEHFSGYAAPPVQKGQRVEIVAGTSDRRWYRVRWHDRGETLIGWAEGRHFTVRGRRSEMDALARAEQERAVQEERREAKRQKEEAARREREERERAAREAAERAQQEAAQRERERQQAERDRAAFQAAREAAVRQEAAEREAAARRREEEIRREREAQERAKQVALERFHWANTVKQTAMLGYIAVLFLPVFRLYRDFIEHRWKQFDGSSAQLLWFAVSAACVWGAGRMVERGSVWQEPELFLSLALLGLPCWFFVPGFLWLFLVFLHSLFVPHPLEATFKRVLRGEPVSADEAAKMAEAMYNAKRDGIPADWRVKSRIRRLERLAALLEKEKAFMEIAGDRILNPNRNRERN